MKTIIFSLLCFEKPECLQDLIENIFFYSSQYKSIILISIKKELYNNIYNLINKYENIYFVTIRNNNNIWGTIDIFDQHMLNVNYLIKNNINFDYFWFISSNEMLIKHIVDEHLSNYIIKIEKQNINLELFQDCIKIQNHNYKEWIKFFNNDVHINEIFNKNKINLYLYQHEGIVLTPNLIFEIRDKYYEYEIYEKCQYNKYALEELFVQSYLISKYNIDIINYFCIRYITISNCYKLNINNKIDCEKLYNICYFHPHAISLKPVPRIFDHPLRQLIRTQMLKENFDLFKLNNFNFKYDIVYFSKYFNSKMYIKNDIIFFDKINKNRSIFCWIGYTLKNIGIYNIFFEIYSNKNIINFNFIKLHKPIFFYKTINIIANTWTNIQIIIETKEHNDLLTIIFDNFEETINLQIRNIKILNNNINLFDYNIFKSDIKLPIWFASGSCRLLKTIGLGIKKIIPLHALFLDDLAGINFLGKLNDIKQHIQFIKFINNIIEIPYDILKLFLSAFNYRKWKYSNIYDNIEIIPSKIKNIKDNFINCHVYIFEISSLKTYLYKNYYVQYEQYHNNIPYDCQLIIQDKNDLLNDLNILISLIPNNKKIIFQCNFRPNIIYNDDSLKIPNREIIYETLIDFAKDKNNIFIYDPSILIKNDPSILIKDDLLYENDIFTNIGYEKSFEYLYNL
jgi:hypothetical protein